MTHANFFEAILLLLLSNIDPIVSYCVTRLLASNDTFAKNKYIFKDICNKAGRLKDY